MCFNRQLESYFVARLKFIPFLRIPKEWYAQQEAKKGLVPREFRASTREPIKDGPTTDTIEKSESCGLIEPKTNINGSLPTAKLGIRSIVLKSYVRPSDLDLRINFPKRELKIINECPSYSF